MPENSAKEILSILSQQRNPRALILGYSYKANVGDTRETPVESLARRLKEGGCQVLIHDPLVDIGETPGWAERVSELSKCKSLDIVIIATFHREYDFSNTQLWDSLKTSMNRARIYDGRRVLSREAMESTDWEYYGVGMPIL